MAGEWKTQGVELVVTSKGERDWNERHAAIRHTKKQFDSLKMQAASDPLAGSFRLSAQPTLQLQFLRVAERVPVVLEANTSLRIQEAICTYVSRV